MDHQPSALVLQRDGATASLLREILAGEGFCCDVVLTAAAALDRLGNRRYDLLVVDAESGPTAFASPSPFILECLSRIAPESIRSTVVVTACRDRLEAIARFSPLAIVEKPLDAATIRSVARRCFRIRATQRSEAVTGPQPLQIRLLR